MAKAGTIEFKAEFMSAGEPLVPSLIPGFGASNRTPETARKHANRAKGARPAEASPKGLSRACVVVERTSPRTWNVRVKGTRALLGTIRSAKGSKGSSYTFKRLGEQRSHAGFPTQKAAVQRLLEKC